MATQSDNTLATKGDLRALYQQKILPHLGAGTAVVEAIGTLAAGATTLTLANNAITTDATIDIYTNVYGVTPTDVVVSNGSVTMTFDAQESAVQVKVRISPSRVVGVGGSNLHTYSTDEQVVGTWIDGKPVYEKTLQVTSPATAGGYSEDIADLTALNIDQVIKMDGIINNTNNDPSAVPYYYSADDQGVRIFYKKDTKKIKMQVKNSINASSTIFLFLQYTKTTD